MESGWDKKRCRMTFGKAVAIFAQDEFCVEILQFRECSRKMLLLLFFIDISCTVPDIKASSRLRELAPAARDGNTQPQTHLKAGDHHFIYPHCRASRHSNLM